MMYQRSKKYWIVVGLFFIIVALIANLNVSFGQSGVSEHQKGVTVGNFMTIKVGPETARAEISPDYVCNGVNDNTKFQSAMDALPSTGGEINTLGGTYYFAALTDVTRALNNITVSGVGQGSYVTGDGVTALFTAGGNNWVFKDIKVDAGGIDMGATTGWQWINVTVAGTIYKYRDEYTSIIGNTLSPTQVAAFTLTGKLTAGAIEIEGSNFDINGGTIDGATITAPTINGVVTTTGLTFPAFTLGGTVTVNAKQFDAGTTDFDIVGTSGYLLNLTMTNDTSTGVETISLHNSTSPAVSDKIFTQYYQGKDSAANTQTYAYDYVVTENVTSTTEAAGREWWNYNAGAANLAMNLSGAGSLWIDSGLTTGGATPNGYYGSHLTDTFTSDGASTVAVGKVFDGTVTGASGDTTYLLGNLINPTIISQNAADAISVISSMRIDEPQITLNGGATVSVASTIFISGAPTEGATNAALYVASGSSRFLGKVDYGDAGSLTIDGAGAVTATKSYQEIVVNGGTGSGADDLVTINGGEDGMTLTIRAATSGAADTVTAKDGTGNMQLTADFAMDSVQDTLTLIYDAGQTAWLEVSRSDNG